MTVLISGGPFIKNQYGKTWLKIFYHNSKNGDWFTSFDDLLSINTEMRYSILGLITEQFKSGDYYEFLLQYPGIPGYNNWKQKIFPLDANQSKHDNIHYLLDSTCHCSWTTTWGGLSLSSTTHQTFIDGSQDGNWWYSIGAKEKYYDSPNQFPGPNEEVNEVYLWIRVPQKVLRQLFPFSCQCSHRFPTIFTLFIIFSK